MTHPGHVAAVKIGLASIREHPRSGVFSPRHDARCQRRARGHRGPRPRRQHRHQRPSVLPGGRGTWLSFGECDIFGNYTVAAADTLTSTVNMSFSGLTVNGTYNVAVSTTLCI